MVPSPSRAGLCEVRWLVASAIWFRLAQQPYAWLPPTAEAALPAVLICFAPAPFLAAFARGGGVRQAALLALLWSGLGVAWLVHCDPVFGVFAWAGTVGFAVLLSLPMGWTMARLRERHGPDAMLWLAPFMFVAWELLRTWGPFGTSWLALAHSWWKATALIQIAELTGPAGCTFAIATVAAGLARWWLGWPRPERQLGLGVALVAALALFGVWRLPQFTAETGRAVSVATVQANVPTAAKRDGQTRELFDAHLALTLRAPRGTELIVWPETSVPDRMMAMPDLRLGVEAAARATGSTLLIGAIDTIPPVSLFSNKLTNSAVVVGPDGRHWDTYSKVRLVILGEYLPGRRWWPVSVLARYTPQFHPGPRFRAVDTPVGRLGVPICYESAFGGDTAAMVRDGAEALVAITNDDQLTNTGARQLMQLSVFRCVETRRWLARAANSGISCMVSPTGELVAASRWQQRCVQTGQIRLRQGQTVRTRCGEWFGWLCMVVVLAALAWSPTRLRAAGATPPAR